jgi:dihydrodipicolinate synthase/N-acetylneuraminate lyase
MSVPQPPVAPRGIIPPLATPLSAPDQLDEAGLDRLIEHVLAGGVHGLFILGTTGEGPSLSYRLRRELIGRTCRQVRSRVPVLVCISDTSLAESLQVARWAADAGADAVVAAPPYYFPADQKELQQYFEQLASASPLPLLLYNMPSMTKVSIGLDTVRRAIDHPRIIGLKDSSGSLGYLHQVLRRRGQRTDWRVFVGDEETLAYAVQAGADGGVTGGANVLPTLYVQFYEAAVRGELARVDYLRNLVIRLGEIYRFGPRHVASSVKGIKCALSLLGVCNDLLSVPLRPFEPCDRAPLGQILKEIADEIRSVSLRHDRAAHSSA